MLLLARSSALRQELLGLCRPHNLQGLPTSVYNSHGNPERAVHVHEK